MVDVDGGDLAAGEAGEGEQGEGVGPPGHGADQRRAGRRERAPAEEAVAVRTGGGVGGDSPRFHRTFEAQGERWPARTCWSRSLTVRIWRRRVIRRRLA